MSPTSRASSHARLRQVQRTIKDQRAEATIERLKKKLCDAAEAKIVEIVARYNAPDWRERLRSSSPIPMDTDPEDEWRLLIAALFPRAATLFVGGIYDSGEGRGEGHFRTASEWISHATIPGPRISPSTFQPDTVSRSKESVLKSPFLVLESDNMIGFKPTTSVECEANKSATAAFFRWCIDALGMRLVAAVDTGHRSLHGWFKMPDNLRVFLELQAMAIAFRLDLDVINNPAAPLRLPGAIHEKTGLPARLLYLDKIA